MKITKFRVWDMDNNWYMEEKLTKVVFKGDEEPDIIYDGELWLAPNNVIIEQSIGFTDGNDNPIFEGDILRIIDRGQSFYDSIVFENGRFKASKEDKRDNMLAFLIENKERYQVQIVGNIHENSDLLETNQ